MSNKTIGLIGCGRWGRYILKDLKSMGCKVIVLALSEKTSKNAQQGQADVVVSDYSTLFDSQCDGYIIAAPTNTHLQIITKLLITGKPIFTEKPLSNDADEAKKLLSKSNSPIFIMDKWKYHNGIIKLAELINSGKYGRVKQLVLKRTQWRSPHQDVDPVWILIPHDISIAQFLLGKTPEALFATGNKIEDDCINSLYAILQADDSNVIIEVSGDSVNVERSVHVTCEHASFHLANAYTDNIQMMENGINAFGDKPTQIPFSTNMPLYDELNSFVNYLSDTSLPLYSSLEEGYETVRLISTLRGMVGD